MLRMDRLYKALAWLASIAIVLGLVIAYMYAKTTLGQFAPAFGVSGSDGLIGAFFKVLRSQIFSMAVNVSTLLVGGVTTLAAALAWVNRRHAWLTALIVVTLLTLAWPSLIIAWQNLYFQPGPAGLSRQEVEVYTFVVFAVQLLPAALALIFALVHRRPAAASTDADAALGVVRSAL
jgi:hypothetical protein